MKKYLIVLSVFVILIIGAVALYFYNKSENGLGNNFTEFDYSEVANKEIVKSIASSTFRIASYVAKSPISVYVYQSIFGTVFYRADFGCCDLGNIYLDSSGREFEPSGKIFLTARENHTNLVNWAYDLGEPELDNTPVYNEGVVYILTDWGEIQAVNINTGEKKWTLKVLDVPVNNDWITTNSPTPLELYGNTLYFHYKLYWHKKHPIMAIDTETGVKKWKKENLSGDIVEVDELGIYVAGEKKEDKKSISNLTLFDGNSGKEIWKIENYTDHAPNSFNSTDEVLVVEVSYSAMGENFKSINYYDIYVFDKNSGNMIWDFHKDEKVISTIVGNSVILDYSRGGFLELYDLATGLYKGEIEADQLIYYKGSIVYVLLITQKSHKDYVGDEISFIAFNVDDFQEKWRITKEMPKGDRIQSSDKFSFIGEGEEYLVFQFSKYKEERWFRDQYVISKAGELLFEMNDVDSIKNQNDLFYHRTKPENQEGSRMVVINPLNGEQLWYKDFDKSFDVKAHQGDITVVETLIPGGVSVSFKFKPRSLLVLENYKTLWEYNSNGNSMPFYITMSNDVVLVRNMNKDTTKSIAGIDKNIGEAIWEVEVSGSPDRLGSTR